MINFINGEFAGGTFTGIFDLEDYRDEDYNMYETMLSNDCWVLNFPNECGEIRVFRAWEEGVLFIPSAVDIECFEYDLFWNSSRTIIFSDIYELHDFILEYRGEKYEDIVNVYDYIRECLEKTEVASRFMCTCGIIEDSDDELFEELQSIIVQKGVKPDTAFATLKMMLLNQYTIQFEEVVPRLAS